MEAEWNGYFYLDKDLLQCTFKGMLHIPCLRKESHSITTQQKEDRGPKCQAMAVETGW